MELNLPGSCAAAVKASLSLLDKPVLRETDSWA